MLDIEAAKDDTRDLRVTTGNRQADEILNGGFPANSIAVIMGHPGTGKTIFAEQLLFHNADGARPVVYLTTLSEPLTKVVTYLQRFDFYNENMIGSRVIYEDVGQELVKQGPQFLVTRIREMIKELSPRIIVVDSFKALHDLDVTNAQMRRVVAELAGLVTAYDVTTFLVGEYSREEIPVYPEFAIADGIIDFARHATGRRDERYLRVLKLRGSSYSEGAHAFRITSAGLQVHPRLVTPTVPRGYTAKVERTTSGIEGLDALLKGGLWEGSNTLVIGSAGSGKTTLALAFALEGVHRGDPTLYVNFQENPTQLARTIGTLQGDPASPLAPQLHLQYASPVELQIDSIVIELFDTVRKHGIKRVVIDALGDLALAATDVERFHDYLYALVQQFAVLGVTSLTTVERLQDNKVATATQAHVSWLSDAIIELDVDLEHGPRRTLRIVKARGTAHDLRPHEMQIHATGMRVLAPIPV